MKSGRWIESLAGAWLCVGRCVSTLINQVQCKNTNAFYNVKNVCIKNYIIKKIIFFQYNIILINILVSWNLNDLIFDSYSNHS